MVGERFRKMFGRFGSWWPSCLAFLSLWEFIFGLIRVVGAKLRTCALWPKHHTLCKCIGVRAPCRRDVATGMPGRARLRGLGGDQLIVLLLTFVRLVCASPPARPPWLYSRSCRAARGRFCQLVAIVRIAVEIGIGGGLSVGDCVFGSESQEVSSALGK